MDKAGNQGADKKIPLSLIYVNSISDFPDPVAGIIDLEEKLYILTTNISTSNKFNVPAGVHAKIIGVSYSILLTYTGADAMFNVVSAGSRITLKEFTASAPSGSIYNVDTEAPITNTYFFITDVDSIGIVKNAPIHFFGCFFQDFSTGLILDSVPILSTGQTTIKNGKNNVDTVLLTLKGTLGSIRLVGITVSAESNEYSLYIDPTSTGGGVVGNCDMAGAGNVFFSDSKDQKDISWIFSNNENIQDSTTTSQIFVGDNSLTSSSPVANIPVMINSNQWNSDFLERITNGTDGVAVYIGLESILLDLTGSVKMAPLLGNTKKLTAQFGHIFNGDSFIITFTNGTNIINETGTDRINGEQISFYDSPGTLPAEIRRDVFYYIINKTTNSFQVSYTSGGAAVTFADDGTPVNNYSVAEIIGVPSTITTNVGDPGSAAILAIVEVKTNDKIVVLVDRLDAPDLIVSGGGWTIKKV